MTGFPGIPSPPSGPSDVPGWLRRVWVTLQQMQQGKLNAVGSVTLASGAVTTTLSDDRISSESWIGLTPESAGAAANITSLYIAAIGNGTASIAHASTATVMNVGYCIIG